MIFFFLTRKDNYIDIVKIIGREVWAKIIMITKALKSKFLRPFKLKAWLDGGNMRSLFYTVDETVIEDRVANRQQIY